VPVIALGAASVVGLGVAVGMTVASNDASADADAQLNAILAARTHCLNPPSAPTERCDELRRTVSRIDAFGNVARVAYAVSGATAIAAVAYALWLKSPGAASSRVRAFPELRVGVGGITVQGIW
jgi:hypothetical protein